MTDILGEMEELINETPSLPLEDKLSIAREYFENFYGHIDSSREEKAGKRKKRPQYHQEMGRD